MGGKQEEGEGKVVPLGRNAVWVRKPTGRITSSRKGGRGRKEGRYNLKERKKAKKEVGRDFIFLHSMKQPNLDR